MGYNYNDTMKIMYESYHGGGKWDWIKNMAYQWCGYVTFDHSFLEWDAYTKCHRVMDAMGYYPGGRDTEPDEMDYMRKEIFPEIADDYNLLRIGEYIKAYMNSVPADERH